MDDIRPEAGHEKTGSFRQNSLRTRLPRRVGSGHTGGPKQDGGRDRYWTIRSGFTRHGGCVQHWHVLRCKYAGAEGPYEPGRERAGQVLVSLACLPRGVHAASGPVPGAVVRGGGVW